MMQYLPQGYSFESYSNPYQSQFVSPFYGSGQYGWQYSPMAQYSPRLPTCTPGTCPPWVPPGLIATPSSGVQELSLLFDPTLAARMSRAYNAWTLGIWGKPDIPAWLWPDGSWPQPVPPNVCCEVPPCALPIPGPGYEPGPGPGNGGGGGGGYPPAGWDPGPGSKLTPHYKGLPPTGFKGPAPKPAMPIPKGPGLGVFPGAKSTPSPNPGDPPCYQAGTKGGCVKCCYDNASSKAGLQSCLGNCVGLPDPKPEPKSWSSMLSTALPTRRQRLANQAVRRSSRMGHSLGRSIPTVKCDVPCPADSPWAGRPFCCPPVRNPRRRVTTR